MANFYPATAAAKAALLKQYKGSRPYIRKWHFPDYARLEQFPGYDGKMKMIFRDAELHRIADGSIVGLEPDPDPAVPQPAFFDVHREIYVEANAILLSMIFRTLSLWRMEDWLMREVFQKIRVANFGSNSLETTTKSLEMEFLF
jgi:hypothetical protein